MKVRDSKPYALPSADASTARPVLITGGSGFVGANLAECLLEQGRSVVLLDNLSRAGVSHNARALGDRFGHRIRLVVGDVRDRSLVRDLVAKASAVFHFAAQVAVTTSLVEPQQDCDVNVQGTLNVLEALRALPSPPMLLFTSTNKVYGDLADVGLAEGPLRYVPRDAELASAGIDESRPLSFCSPYGCSKGAADQYVLDYAHSYGLRTVVFRMSCIYGPKQFGTEDQGWVAHFLIKAARREPVTIYGDGKQVRDILYVGDLLDAMLLAEANIERLSGHAFNIGGGASNVISLRELLQRAEELSGRPVPVRFDAMRTGDQLYYVSNTARFRQLTGWAPKVAVREGIGRLYEWLSRHRTTQGSAADDSARLLGAKQIADRAST